MRVIGLRLVVERVLLAVSLLIGVVATVSIGQALGAALGTAYTEEGGVSRLLD
jgi:hypothetical protein